MIAGAVLDAAAIVALGAGLATVGTVASGAAASAAIANSLAATAKTEAEAAQATADDVARSVGEKVLFFYGKYFTTIQNL